MWPSHVNYSLTIASKIIRDRAGEWNIACYRRVCPPLALPEQKNGDSYEEE
jgi:hypothetical protein